VKSEFLRRILLGAAVSLFYSVTLGLLFAVCSNGRPSLSILTLPGVVPVALMFSGLAAAAMMPAAAWCLRTGIRNLLIYGPILWSIVAAWIVASAPAHLGLYSTWILGLVGVVLIGFIPNRKK